MSRKPITPTDDEGPAGNNSTKDIPAGRRFVSETIREIEAELVAEGVDLPNRGVPSSDRGLADAETIRETIEEEAASEHPNKNRIAYLNSKL